MGTGEIYCPHASPSKHMTPTAKEYSNCLGKLYVMPLAGYELRLWHAKNRDVKEVPLTLIMPYALNKVGGWWHFECEILTNKDYYASWARTRNCKDFLKKATLYHDNRPSVQ